MPFQLLKSLRSPLGSTTAYQFGLGLLAADMDGDGFDDLVFSEHLAKVGGMNKAGRFWIFYGPTFSRYRRVQAQQPLAFEKLGSVRGSVGDVNGDGALDLLAPAPAWPAGPTSLPELFFGRVHIFLGPDYGTDLVFEDRTPEPEGIFGHGNLLADINGDGVDELILAAPGANGGNGELWLESSDGGAGPQVIASPYASFPGFFSIFGQDMIYADVDGDSRRELLVSAPLTTTLVHPGCYGVIAVIDPVSATIERTIYPPLGQLTNFGYTIAVGDLTGDGVNDLVASSPDGLLGEGAVLVLEGPAFTRVAYLILSPLRNQTDAFGKEFLLEDMNGDEQLDLVVFDPEYSPSPGPGPNAVRIYYGPDFRHVQSLGESSTPNRSLGLYLAAGDFDHDGHRDLAAYEERPTQSGVVHVFDVQTLFGDTTSLSLSQGGTLNLTLDVGPAHAHRGYLAALGHSGVEPGIVRPAPDPLHVPLNVDPLTHAGIAALGHPFLEGFTGNLDSKGRAVFAFQMPAHMPFVAVGETLVVAAVVLDDALQPLLGSSAVQVALNP